MNLIELRHERQWRNYAADEESFFHDAVQIRHPERGAIPLEMRPAQRSTLAIWQHERQSIALKSRQIGFSTLVAAHVLHTALFGKDRFVILLSKTERDAGKLLEKVVYAYTRLPHWMKERVERTNKAELKMTFSNGGVIESLPASDPARGDAAYLIVVDEWAFFDDPESAWASVEPAYDIGGRIIALSTANGWGTLFHSMYVSADTGISAFKSIFHGYDAVPERGDVWYESKRREFAGREHLLHQEYPRNPDEAFAKSGNPVFDVDFLRQCPTKPPVWRGSLHHVNSVKNFVQTESSAGPLKVWDHPDPEHKYVIGADVAMGLEHGDFSTAHVIDATTGVVVAHWHGHLDPDLFGVELAKLGWWYNYSLMAPEANSHGLSTVKGLQRVGYRNIYRTRSLQDRHERKGETLGFYTRKNTKPIIIDDLRLAIRDGSLTLWDHETLAEMRTYVRDERGGMHGSPYDDRVMSLAIANHMVQYVHDVQYAVHSDNYWTVDWFAGLIDEQKKGGQEFAIGEHSTR